ncbi:hypothetical protein [Nonomuraea longicatena]|uniref:hypothetical protein n=1 Tax=Nonomuraea longicatena TaxID=83682 RepID=UPI0031CF968B
MISRPETTETAEPDGVADTVAEVRPEREGAVRRVRKVRTSVRARRPSARNRRTPFVVLVLGLLGGGLVSLLLLNTVLAEDSVRATKLKGEIADLQLSNESVKTELIKLDTPQQRAKAAADAGDVRDWKEPGVITVPADDEVSQVSKVGTDR